nr:Rieske 2Fe-2S domain-containing protein [Ramlibacter albus]
MCRADEIAEGSARGFDPTGTGRDTIFVVRRDGYHGWRNECPHWANTSMAWRKDAFLNADASRIVCAAHGAQFEIDTGLCVLGPCLGESLRPVPLTRNDHGELQVRLSDLGHAGSERMTT